MVLRICTIDNLSAAAYRLAAPRFAAVIDAAPPAECYRRMRAGVCDAALIPAARLHDFPMPLTLPGPFGIACGGPVHSVLLFSDVPVEVLALEQRAVHATNKSETSRRLLNELFKIAFGRVPRLAQTAKKASAQLLIGDDAVREYNRIGCRAYVYDLSAWWHRLTGLPFVFGRWVARPDLRREERCALKNWLKENAVLAESSLGRGRLVQRGLRFGYKPAFLTRYYRDVRPRLTMEDLAGLDMFLGLLTMETPCDKIA